MHIQRGFAGGTTVALLLAVGATASAAQSMNAGSEFANSAVSRPELSAAPTASASVHSSNALAWTRNAPLLPPPQLSHKKAMLLGIVIGGAVGATAGYFIAHDSCNSCKDSGPVALVSALGAVAGGALGGFVAARNSPPDVSPSSLRAAPSKFLAVPHPVLQYKLAAFR